MQLDSRVSDAIITTWQISFEQIRKKRPEAIELLLLMTMFDRFGDSICTMAEPEEDEKVEQEKAAKERAKQEKETERIKKRRLYEEALSREPTMK
ncbi:hypothetical protein VE04_05486 [Pseudogymnoascus sp. 24MN13]|nr:hypothetical protein VE04_05486 [Pseudogymnoascus sp. 24MN13]